MQQKQPKLATNQIIKSINGKEGKQPGRSSLEFSVFILSKLSLQFSRKKEETEPKSHAKRNGIAKKGGTYRRKSLEKKKSQIQRKESQTGRSFRKIHSISQREDVRICHSDVVGCCNSVAPNIPNNCTNQVLSHIFKYSHL